MNVTPVNIVRFGEITSSDVENMERKINDLQAVLERKELADIKREAERNNRPYYPPNYSYPGRNPYGPHGIPGRYGYPYGQPYGYPYGQPYGQPTYGMPAGQPYGAPHGNHYGTPYGQPCGNTYYPPLNGQPPMDTYGNPPRY